MSGFEILKWFLLLAFLFALLYLSSLLAKRARTGSYGRVIDSLFLTPNHSLLIVECSKGKFFLLGLAPNAIELLHSFGPDELEALDLPTLGIPTSSQASYLGRILEFIGTKKA